MRTASPEIATWFLAEVAFFSTHFCGAKGLLCNASGSDEPTRLYSVFPSPRLSLISVAKSESGLPSLGLGFRYIFGVRLEQFNSEYFTMVATSPSTTYSPLSPKSTRSSSISLTNCSQSNVVWRYTLLENLVNPEASASIISSFSTPLVMTKAA